MSDSTEIKSLVTTFLVSNGNLAPEAEIDDDANLLVDGTLDSISVMRLIAHLETKLNIKIPPKDLVPKNFMTLNAMATYLSAKANEAPAS